MDKTAALARLGLSGDEDAIAVTRVYGERLSTVQERLVSAQTDADRQQSQTDLSDLVEAYEFITSTGRYTKVRADQNATVARTGTEMAAVAVHDTLVRLEPGVVISDRLEIGPMLGQGGMGNVYAARDRLKEEDVAIKVLRQDLQFSTAAKDRFLAEAKVSCSLSHPNIVRVHDVGVSNGFYYFSMERLKGHTLRQRIEVYHREKRQFGMEEVSDFARQLIDALRYAHRYIVHRDLKPENVWLTEDGTVKLMDFGIARAFTASQLTQTGMTLGTAYYMAPEQRIAAKEVDWRADQYALGVMLYELFAGTLPTGAVTPLENIRRDLPKRYARALMRAMSPKPEDRFASFNELLGEMRVQNRRSPVGIGALLMIAAGATAAVAGGYIAYNKFLTPQSPPTQTIAASDAPTSQASSPGGGADAAGASGASGAAGSGSGSAPPPSESGGGATPPEQAASAVVPPQEPEKPPQETGASGTSIADRLPAGSEAASVKEASTANESPPAESKRVAMGRRRRASTRAARNAWTNAIATKASAAASAAAASRSACARSLSAAIAARRRGLRLRAARSTVAIAASQPLTRAAASRASPPVIKRVSMFSADRSPRAYRTATVTRAKATSSVCRNCRSVGRPANSGLNRSRDSAARASASGWQEGLRDLRQESRRPLRQVGLTAGKNQEAAASKRQASLLGCRESRANLSRGAGSATQVTIVSGLPTAHCQPNALAFCREAYCQPVALASVYDTLASGERVIHLLHILVLLQKIDELEDLRCVALRELGRAHADVLVLG